MPEIFISYAREDEERIRPLADHLSGLGWDVFWDRTIPPGKTWDDTIGVALEEARCVLVGWSASSVVSDFVLEEAHDARERGVLIPFLLEDIRPPFGFRRMVAADLAAWNRNTNGPRLDELISAVRDLIGPAGDGGADSQEPELPGEHEPDESLAASQSEPAAEQQRAADPSPERAISEQPEESVTAQPPSPPAAPAPRLPTSKPDSRVGSARGSGFYVAIGLGVAALAAGAWYFTTHTNGTPQPSAKSQSWEPEMVEAPADTFLMGSENGGSHEQPVRVMDVPRAFRIGKYEVTFDQYDAYADLAGIDKPGDKGWGRGDRPVINVSWNNVQSYVAWLRKETKKCYRLPTEAEWEYVARAGTETEYWWGDDIRRNGNEVMANCSGCSSRWDGDETAPVGQFPANDFGLQDTAGNVWEWVQDCYVGEYDPALKDASVAVEPKTGGECELRVLRGGSWDYLPGVLRSAYRDRDRPALRCYDVGFRLAQDKDCSL